MRDSEIGRVSHPSVPLVSCNPEGVICKHSCGSGTRLYLYLYLYLFCFCKEHSREYPRKNNKGSESVLENE